MLFALTMLTNCSAKNKTEKETEKNVKTEQKEILTNKNENDKVKFINIEYSNKIEGLNVSVAFRPIILKGGDMVSGTAIIEFNNGKSSYTLTNKHFAISSKLIEYTSKDDWHIDDFTPKDLVLDYKNPKIKNSLEGIKVPFFFYDINFDGNKELIISEYANGQRDVNNYNVYLFEKGKLVDDLSESIQEAPYSELDGFSKVNRINNEITIYYSSGWCSGSFYTYKLQKNGKLELSKMIKNERNDDTGKCFELTYEVNNGEKKLISKKEIQ